MKNLILLIAIIFQFNDSYAQQPKIKFKNIKVEDGLSQSWVKAICQDHQGFMWFGTGDGLNKYDGYTITSYFHNPQDKNSLCNNMINVIFEDSKGNLWIGTDWGLSLYDRMNDRFINRSQWSQGAITDFLELVDGRFYITTLANGLLLFDPETGIVNSFVHDEFNINNIEIETILKDSHGNIWVGTNDGLMLINPVNHKVITFRKDNNDAHSISDNYIKSLLEDDCGRIWVGTSNNGLNLLKYEPNHPEKSRFTRFVHHSERETSISPGAVLALLADATGHLWIGTENGGLDLIHLNNFQEEKVVFDHYRLDPFDNKSLSSNSIYLLFEDRDGGIWVGSNGGGINYYHPLKNKFVHIKQQYNNPNSLNNNFVNAFYEEGELLWIGTEGGINLYNKKNGSYRHFVYDPNNDRTIGSNAIWSIYRDSRQNLWFGTWAGGLNLFDSKNNTFTRFKHNSQDNSSISSNNVFAILEDRAGNLWIPTMGGGLNQFDYNTKTFKNYNQSFHDSSRISNDWISLIVEDSFGKIWISTYGGMDVFDQATGTFSQIRHDTSDAKSISDNIAIYFFEDSQKNFWIGTSSGLNVYNRAANNFDCYTIEHGLPNNQIKGILEDDTGNLWLSTNKGISKFIQGTKRPEKLVFKNYDLDDGLQGNEFRIRSCYRGQNGSMYFGGNNGYNVFHPDSIRENTCPPQVVLTNFYLFNKSVDIGTKESPLKSHISVAKSIILSHDQSVISFEYAALNYLVPEKNQYAYKLEGFEKNWNYLGNKRIATYTNLDPGKYTFRVKASNNDGIWNEVGVSLKINILPPWWKTWWCRLLFIILIISAFFGFYYYRVARIRNLNLKLRKLVVERTKVIEQKNKELIKQSEIVNETNSLLEERQQRIEEQTEELMTQKEELVRINNELNDLNATKDKFFTIIAHDLKNPFNAILGFGELLMLKFEKYNDEKKKNLIKAIYDSSKNIYKLLENLLQWSRSQTGNMEFKPEEFYLNELIDSNKVLVENLLKDKYIQISTIGIENIKVYADKNMINMVLRNLIANAIKFTENGFIRIECEQDNLQVVVKIIDSGVGIDQEKIAGLFDIGSSKSTHGTREESGTGLGLILCKEFVEKNKGTIHVESEEGKGSTFYFTLPIKPE